MLKKELLGVVNDERKEKEKTQVFLVYGKNTDTAYVNRDSGSFLL